MRHLFSVALITLLCVPLSWAQTTQPATSHAATATSAATTPLPTDPKQLMLLASQVNGLRGIDKPWHIKANYQTFDADGKPKDQGVFEEWWAGPKKYKISYASGEFNQSRYGADAGLLMTGDHTAPSLAEAMIENLLVQPIPVTREIKAQRYLVQNAKDGPVALICLREQGKNIVVPVYCFQNDSSMVRLEALRDGSMVFFNDIVSLGGKYVAKRIDVKFANLPMLNVQVTTLEPLAEVDDTTFVPPAEAVTALLPPQFKPLEDVRLISVEKHPETPPIARAAHVHGEVILAAIISPKGDVSEVHVISGPAMLRQAAIDSVKTYHFAPYKVKGQPTAVEILIESYFHSVY